MNTYIKRFDITVDSANETYTQEFELDKDLKFVRGFLLTADQDDLLYYRGTAGIYINGNEFLPDDHEARLLMTGLNTDPNARYYSTGKAEVLNGKIKLVYTDANNVNTTFAEYRVSLYVKAEKAS